VSSSSRHYICIYSQSHIFDSQRELGANLDVDVSYEWLTFFLESDERLAEIARDYASGAMLTGEVKKELVGVLTVRA
jgi:tryptophanyl-tRNA synthetase